MRPRQTIVLWAVFLALCVAYWWTVRSEQEALQAREEARAVFAGRTAGDLQRITIARIGESPVVAERTAAGWAITAPHAIEASPQVWSRIADAVAALKNERTLDGADDLALFGLDTPRLRATLEWSDGTTHSLAYGVMEPTARFRYVQDGDGTTFLAANDAFVELDRPLPDLRNRYLVGTGRERVERVAYTRVRMPNEGETPTDGMPPELEGGVLQATVMFELDDDGAWQQTSPIPGLANQELVDEFITHVQFSAGRDFNDTPAPLRNYGMQPGPVRLEVWFEPDDPADEPASQVVYLGGPADERGDTIYAKRDGQDTVFAIDATTLGYFPDTPNAFLEHRLVTHGTRGLHRITYRWGEQVVVMEDQGDLGWRMAAPERASLDSMTFSNFVAFVSQIEGTGFPMGEPAQFGLDDPAIELLLEYEGEGAPADVQPVRIGRADATGEQYYAQSDRGSVVTLSATHVEALRKDAFYFQDKALLRFLPASARNIFLTFEGQPYEFANVDGLWVVNHPEGLRWESQADMRIILDALAQLRAVAVETPGEPDEDSLESYGLAYPILSAEVIVVAGEGTAPAGSIEVGGVAPAPAQSRYARSSNREGVYHVDQTLVDDIREALRGIVRVE